MMDGQNNYSFVDPINVTKHHGPAIPQLKKALDITLVTLLVVIMLAMGCVITWKEVWKHVRRPIGILIGMSSQFILLPLVGFGLAHAFRLSPYHAIGLLVLTCSPGGTTSNIFTYLSEGDVNLSVVMTTVSTVLALGFMPVNLLLYSRSWTDEALRVPYNKIALTLVFILIPVAVGMVIRWKFTKIALAISKVGSIAGLLAICSTIIMQSILYPFIFHQPWSVWLACAALPIFGFCVGFLLSLLTRQAPPVARTVGIETGAQNVSLALTVLLLSFPLDAQEDMSIIPILFSIFVLVEGMIFCIIFRLCIHCNANSEFQEVQQDDDSSDNGHKRSEDYIRVELPALETNMPIKAI